MDSVRDDGDGFDFEDPEYRQWVAEMDAQRAQDEATVALRYELEHRQRFGNGDDDWFDFGGEG